MPTPINGLSPASWPPPALRCGGVIAYHSALELHGCAYTEGQEIQVIAHGEPGVFEAIGLTCRFVKPLRSFVQRNGH